MPSFLQNICNKLFGQRGVNFWGLYKPKRRYGFLLSGISYAWVISSGKVIMVLLVSLVSLVIFVANVVKNVYPQPANDYMAIFYKYTPSITFGLDIKGGSQLLIDVNVDKVIDERIVSIGKQLASVLWEERIPHGKVSVLGGGKVHIKNPEVGKLDKGFIRSSLKSLSLEDLEMVSVEDGVVVQIGKDGLAQLKTVAVERTMDIVRRRMDSVGTKEILVQRIGGDKILIQVPGVQNPDEIKRLLGRVARLTFHLLHPTRPASYQQEDDLANGYVSVQGNTNMSKIWYSVKVDPELSGEHLVDARASTTADMKIVISFRLDRFGADKFAYITEENIGKPLAIMLDDEVLTAPVINSAITGGAGVITGQFSYSEASDLAAMLRSGALPTDIRIVEERVIGPSLGAKAIKDAGIAGCFGILLVMLFMVLYYKTLGMVAATSLLINLTMAVSVMAIFGITLTLQGVAGLVLMIGMSVDANVLINERMRDEITKNRSRDVSSIISNGFAGAWTGIFDSNATTAISAATMLFFGSVFVKGFAAGLLTGIGCSMFSAIVFNRLATNYLFVQKRFRLPLKSSKAS